MNVFIVEIEQEVGLQATVRVEFRTDTGIVINESATGDRGRIFAIGHYLHKACMARTPYEGPSLFDLVTGRAQVVEDVVRVVDNQPRLENDPIKLFGGPVPKEFP